MAKYLAIEPWAVPTHWAHSLHCIKKGNCDQFM